jgi:pimeloyl-ACP methyl ester carboxylesterase
MVSGLAGLPIRAHVVDVGQGAPVVFLHGLVGLNDHWDEVVLRVRQNRRCILLQLPLLDLEGDDCSIDGATELTARFLRSYVKEPCFLVGNSFGGHVALRLAIERQDLVRGLILAGASGLNERTTIREVQIRPSREWLEEKIGELFYDRTKMNPTDVDRAFAELSERGHARAMVKLSRSARRNHLGEEIQKIAAPTLLIWGKQDIVTPPDAVGEFTSKIRDTRVVWLDQCGHAPMIEWPELFAQGMLDFFADVDARQR